MYDICDEGVWNNFITFIVHLASMTCLFCIFCAPLKHVKESHVTVWIVFFVVAARKKTQPIGFG